MRVLIVDTALGACTAGVVEDGRVLGLRSELMTKGHQERLAGMARDAVADAGGGFDALDRIGVTVGPGSFTGLRVGMAFAQGLGAALDRPVVGVSTLDALAASIEPAGLVAAVIDARRGQVYARLFGDGVALGEAEERLAGMARDAVAEAGGGFDALDRIGVTVGPGSFTGLRVGMAFAQGLGAALDRPVVGVSTLDALAASIEPAGLVAAVIDARRGQVYARLFGDGVALGEAEALSLDTATDRILTAAAGAIPTLVGSGALLLSETFPDQFSDVVLKPLPAPTPEALARLTAAADPATALPRPLYLRAPDATPPSRLPGQPRPPLAS